MRILIVEDNALTRLMMERNLKKWGYDVTAVDNINAAMEAIMAESIQFVITDWMMPGGNGTELCKQIRTFNLPYYTYIIVVTFLDDAQSLVQGMDAGADDFIRKPIQLDELHARIRAGLRVLELERKLQENNGHLTEISNKLLAANEVISRDLKMAATMQRNLLPRIATRYQDIAIEWLFHPSADLSGDIFNFFPLDQTHVGFYILDVAGHGIASAMHSFTLSRLLSPDISSSNHLMFSTPELPDVQLVRPAAAVVGSLNQQFQTDSANILYFTMIYGIVDTESKAIELCQAGHPHPLFLQQGKQPQFVLNAGISGLPVGVIADVSYESVTLNYNTGDRLFLFSDGITECESPSGELFGTERLRQFIEAHRELTLSEVICKLDGHIRAWHGGDDFEDDVSMLILDFC